MTKYSSVFSFFFDKFVHSGLPRKVVFHFARHKRAYGPLFKVKPPLEKQFTGLFFSAECIFPIPKISVIRIEILGYFFLIPIIPKMSVIFCFAYVYFSKKHIIIAESIKNYPQKYKFFYFYFLYYFFHFFLNIYFTISTSR